MSRIQSMSDNARIVEVILYVENEAISISRISELSGLSAVEVKTALKELRELSIQLNRGLQLTEEDEQKIEFVLEDIHKITESEVPQKVEKKSICKSCAYYDLCFI